MPENQWPMDVKETILQDFHHDTNDADAGSNEPSQILVGDRRQEIVIIGKSSMLNEDQIRHVLDDCLLSDDEFETYKGIVLGTNSHDDGNVGDRLSNVFECPEELQF